MTRNINKRIEAKADKEVVNTRFESVENDIIDIKSNATEDRKLFLNEIRELRTDLRLKKDK